MQYSMNEQEVAAIKSHIFDIPFKAVKVEAATYAFTKFCECCGRKFKAKKNKWIYCKDCFQHYYTPPKGIMIKTEVECSHEKYKLQQEKLTAMMRAEFKADKTAAERRK